MNEIKRSDSLNLDHYVEYLQSNGLFVDENSPLPSRINITSKNVAGDNVKDFPVILNNNMTLSDILIGDK